MNINGWCEGGIHYQFLGGNQFCPWVRRRVFLYFGVGNLWSQESPKNIEKTRIKRKMRSATNLSTNRTAWKLEGIAIKMVFAQANVPGTRSPHPEFSGFLIQFFVIFLPSCRGPVRQRETKHYGVNGGRQNFIFPVQLTTDHEQN